MPTHHIIGRTVQCSERARLTTCDAHEGGFSGGGRGLILSNLVVGAAESANLTSCSHWFQEISRAHFVWAPPLSLERRVVCTHTSRVLSVLEQREARSRLENCDTNFSISSDYISALSSRNMELDPRQPKRCGSGSVSVELLLLIAASCLDY